MKTKLLRIAFIALLGLVMLNIQTYASIIFVNENTPATPPNQTGSTWALAFEYMQDALFIAQPGDEIWVATGTYYPDDSYNNPAIVNGDIGASFSILFELSIYGGFEGWEQSTNNRSADISEFQTIFSGNIGINHSGGIIACNCYTLGISRNVCFNRIVIEQAGQIAIGVSYTNIEIRDCLIRNNLTTICITLHKTTATIESCIIEDNYSIRPTILIVDASASFNNVIIRNNYFEGYTHCLLDCRRSILDMNSCLVENNNGIDNDAPCFDLVATKATIIECDFIGNSTSASVNPISFKRNRLFNTDTEILIDGCRFTSNGTESTSLGGTVGIKGGSAPLQATIKNCIFNNNISRGNTSLYDGAAIRVELSEEFQNARIDILNNTFYNNELVTDPSVLYEGHEIFAELPYGGNDQITVTNCIFWDGDNDNHKIGTSNGIHLAVSYSDVENGYTGAGNNIDIDPKFVDAANSNFHLKSKEGHWDPNSPNGWTVDRQHSPCIDKGNPMSDFSHEPDPNGGIVNMGAYGNTEEASKSRTNTIIYVDKNVIGGNDDGSSWANAYVHLQDALYDAAPGDQIWVAQGVYFPDWDPILKYYTGNRETSFSMINEVAVYGGFAPSQNITEFNNRNWYVYTTTLSGNIGLYTNADNSFHVIYNPESAGLNNSAILDGFHITDGYANSAANSYGGGMYNVYSSPTIRNCSFHSNNAFGGGGMCNENNSSPTIQNSIYYQNHASYYGGGILNNNSSNPSIINCTLRYNNASIQGSGMLSNNNCNASVENCIFWENGTQEIVDVDNSITAVKYSDIKLTTGVYEGEGNLNSDPLFVNPSAHNYLLKSEEGHWTTTGWVIDNGTSACIDAGNPNTEWINEQFPNGHKINMGAYGNTFLASLSNTLIVYVDADNNDPNFGDGTSWETAYRFLHDALGSNKHEIWVAAGTYYPDEDNSIPNGTNDRTTSFNITGDVAVYGGFDPSFGVRDFQDRDWDTYQTVLSGDIGTPDNTIDNSYRVIYNLNSSFQTVFDGLIITRGNGNGGNQNGETGYSLGAGMYCKSSSAIVKNCTFKDNLISHTSTSNAMGGGGIRAWNSSLDVENCHFINNIASPLSVGAAISIDNSTSSIAITNCEFVNNVSDLAGGAIHLTFNGFITFINNCVFKNNHANSAGGAIFNQSAGIHMLDNTFLNNTSYSDGGAIYSNQAGGDIVAENCLFAENTASNRGGGIYFNSPTQIMNCTFVDNDAAYGPSVAYYQAFNETQILNSIIWGEASNQIFSVLGGIISIDYSDIKVPDVTIYGEGNMNEPPSFYNPLDHDYHLVSPGGRWDPSTNGFVTTDTECSPCIDRGDPQTPCNEPDSGPIVNMGAHGNTDQASYSCDIKKSSEFNDWQTDLNPSNVSLICKISPNPFSQNLTIEINLPDDSFVNICVFNITGQKVKTIAQENYMAGTITFKWDGKDEYAKDLPNGIYLVAIETNGHYQSNKVMLRK
jgi:predicted outer membrane repeat protein